MPDPSPPTKTPSAKTHRSEVNERACESLIKNNADDPATVRFALDIVRGAIDGLMHMGSNPNSEPPKQVNVPKMTRHVTGLIEAAADDLGLSQDSVYIIRSVLHHAAKYEKRQISFIALEAAQRLHEGWRPVWWPHPWEPMIAYASSVIHMELRKASVTSLTSQIIPMQPAVDKQPDEDEFANRFIKPGAQAGGAFVREKLLEVVRSRGRRNIIPPEYVSREDLAERKTQPH